MPHRKTPASLSDTPPIETPRVKKPRVKKIAPAKKTPARARSTSKTKAAAPPTASLIPPAPSPVRAMSAMHCFMYGGVVCLVGTVALGLLLGLAILPPLVTSYEQSQYSYAAPLSPNFPSSQSPQTDGADPGTGADVEYGFYGTLLSREENVLMVQELFPPLPLEEKAVRTAKTFVVRVSENTEYTHQRQRADDDITAPLFSPESGLLEDIKEQAYVFVSTPDNPEQSDTVTATHVIYSEQSPFTE